MRAEQYFQCLFSRECQGESGQAVCARGDRGGQEERSPQTNIGNIREETKQGGAGPVSGAARKHL